MFKSAELGHKIDKHVYDKEIPVLRKALLDAQFNLVNAANFQVIILVGGVAGAGRRETINLLNEWMDPRYIQTHAMGNPSDEELDRPMMWRFWRALPPKSRIGVFLGSWYTWPILNQVHGITTAAELHQSLERAKLLEQMLYSDGAVIIKLWLHLSKDKQEKRLNALHKNPATRWRVTDRDFKQLSAYDKFQSVHENVIRQTNTIEAPWNIIEGADPYYRNLTVGRIILETLLNRLDQVNTTAHKINVAPRLPPVDNLHILKSLDLTKSIEKKKFKLELEKYQEKLNLLSRDPRFKEMSVVVVFEGNDAAGKGGSIRRITAALDARNYQVIPIAAPTEEERAQPYLWRFWRHIPRKRRVTIFDRSWYGRVLVERVEGFCSENDWLRAYNEINEFEAELTRHDILVVKFWLAISKDEQLRRFEDRQKTAYKSFKITEEDWRNREKWDEYEQAVCDMIDHTSTAASPWTLVEANDKNYARIKILKTLCSQIEDMLDSLPSHEKTANK